MSAHLFQPTDVAAIYDNGSELWLMSVLRLGQNLSARPGSQLDRVNSLRSFQGDPQLIIITLLVLVGVLCTPSNSFLHLLLKG